MSDRNMLENLGQRARIAAQELSCACSAQKNAALCAIAKYIRANSSALLEANENDMHNAEKNGMSQSLQDRLRLTAERVEAIAQAVLTLKDQTDPIGQIIGGETRPNGLKVEQVRVPLGIVGIIYEARPNVTVDAAVLCLKSSNVCILRGGKEAIHSNTALWEVMCEALEEVGLPRDCILLVTDTSRESATALMTLNEYIDVLIPRGGKGLIHSVVKNASVPVIETGAGNCHIFVDESADLEMAVRVCDNAKTSRPSVCNAAETVLVHREVAAEFLPLLKKALDVHKVELRGCARTAAIIPDVKVATEEDYATEFDDYILALRVVDSLDEAINHIRMYTTGHSEAIMTNSYVNAKMFTEKIDSAVVYVNASTRFTDGGELGLGAEIGISTQKLHARGPMGLTALTSTKYIITGSGQIR